MSAPRASALLILVLFALAASVHSAVAPNPGEPSAEAAADTGRVTFAAPIEPLAQRIDALLVAEQAAVDEISAAIAATADPTQRLDLIRRLEATKLRGEAAVLDLRADAAEAAGRVDAAEELRAAAGQLREIVAATPAGPVALQNGGRP